MLLTTRDAGRCSAAPWTAYPPMQDNPAHCGQSERLMIEPAEDLPARDPSTGQEEADGEPALTH